MNPTRRTVLLAGAGTAAALRAARFEVRAVGELYTTSAPATATHPW